MRIAPGADHPTALRIDRTGIPSGIRPTERRGVQTRRDRDAMGLREEISRDGLVGRLHDLRKHSRPSFRRSVASSCARNGGATHAAATIVAIINLMLHLPSFML